MSLVPSELFIKDAVSNAARIKGILHKDFGLTDWRFIMRPPAATPDNKGDLFDVVNQEVSIPSGRIDVLATFNKRQSVVVIEVKQGVATLDALKQLQCYLDPSPLKELLGIPISDPLHCIGMLIAEDFVNIPEVPENVALIKFSLLEHPFFKKVAPSATPGDSNEERPTVTRLSRLFDFERDHLEYIRDQVVRNAFREISQCFLDESRQDWVVCNPKSRHVAIHYKGAYIAWMVSQRKGFYLGGYDLLKKALWINAQSWEQHRSTIESDFAKIREQVDERSDSFLPPGFSWDMPDGET